MRYKYLDPAGWAARGAWVYDRLRPVSWVTVACQSFDSGLLSDRPSRLGPQACISEAGWSPLCQSARSARAGPGFVSGRLSQPGTCLGSESPESDGLPVPPCLTRRVAAAAPGRGVLVHNLVEP